MNINTAKINLFTTKLFLVSIIIIPQSFAFIKISFLALFILSHFLGFYLGNKLKVYSLVLLFYILVVAAAIIWSIVGIIYGNPFQGIYDSLKLWGFWSVSYFLVITLLSQGNKLKMLHEVIVVSGILIVAINAIGMYDFYYKAGLIPSSIIDDMDLKVGFHEGYIQMTAHNIGSLLFIVPYLIAIQFRSDKKVYNTTTTKVSLILTLIITILSGRRALWLCVFLTPIIIGLTALVTGNFKRITVVGKTLMYFTIVFGILGIVFLMLSGSIDNPTLTHFKDAFSAEDERTIQKGYLINAFFKYPIFGSGFGGYAGYARSELMPWLYELTYHQLLFNFGTVGCLYLLSIFLFYLFIIFKILKRKDENAVFLFAILIGFFAFLIGAYSNPYFMSFDFIFYIGMMPYITVFITKPTNTLNQV